MEAAAFRRPPPVVKIEKLVGDGVKSPSKQPLVVKVDHLMESARAEMGEVREENQRLKTSLSKIMKDYEALRMQFIGIAQHESNKLPQKGDDKLNNAVDRNQPDETELVSLSLGRHPAVEKNKKSSQGRGVIGNENEDAKESLSLGLSCKFEGESMTVKETDHPNQSVANSFDHEAKEEEAGETIWSPNKGAKTMRSSDDDVTPQNPPKRARVCVRARCETTTMNDGCQWRKYGQKIAKGNPCPRAYYRCTGSPTCPVRKQVQRCVDDMSILITTYEGTHNHQLPVSATAMAATTSAAASMLLSGSTSSANLHGLNFYKPNLYLPNNPSIISSTSQTNPTITLDLTPNIPSSSSNSSTHFGKYSTNSRYPFTSHLDFGSSRNNVLTWNNNDFISYNNRNNNLVTANNVYQSYFQQQRNHNLNHHSVIDSSAKSLPHQHQPLPDTITAATKAITADPSFQSALAAALTSIIGTGSGGGGGGDVIKSSTRGEPSLLELTSTTTMVSKGN